METGVRVVSITCDGLASNLTLMKLMGASLDTDNLQTELNLTDKGEPINFVFDNCHLVKLVRNCLGDYKVLKHNGNEIKWDYIAALQLLQEKEGLLVANKLKKPHINYSKQIMKVNLAVQTISSSVAIAIDYCRDNLNLPQFAGSEATTRFIRIFDKLFDIFNSRNRLGRQSKQALSQKNFSETLEFLNESVSYIKSLSNIKGVLLIKCRRKTAFLGYLFNIQSLQSIFQRLILRGQLQYLLTYKLSQDHLELFFGAIRARNGCNNNPTTVQFQSAYKALLTHATINGLKGGNCIFQGETEIETITSNDVQHYFEDKYSIIDKNIDCAMFSRIERLSKLTDLQISVTQYIAGYVVKKLPKLFDCKICLSTTTLTTRTGLVKVKDWANKLISPSNDVYLICCLCEKHMQQQR